MAARCIAVLAGLLLVAGGFAAGDDVESLVNYAYASSDTAFTDVVGQSVQAARLPISWTVRSLDDHPWGLKLTFPVSFGFHEFEAGELRESLGTISALAGAEFSFPVGRKWTLIPFSEVGAGRDFDGRATATIYSAGLKTLFVTKPKRLTYRFGLDLDHDGSTLSGSSGTSVGYTTLEAGLDVRFPLGKRMFGRQSDWSVYGIRRRFLEELSFRQLDGSETSLRNQNEIGFTLGIEHPLKLWLLKIDRIGVGYRFGERLSSVRLLFGVPF